MDRRVFLSIFASSFLFLAGYYASAYLYEDASLLSTPFFAVLAISLAVAIHFLGWRGGSAPAFLAFSAAYLLLSGLPGIQTLFLHMSLISLAVYLLWAKREELIKGCGNIKKRAAYGFLILLFLLAAAVAANVAAYLLGWGDQLRVQEIVGSLPLYIILLTFTLGPLSEELFFRAFLVPRAGILPSTILFAATHFAYGSVSELAGAFFLGLVLAIAYDFLKDPLPCIIAHALFNLLAVVLMLWVV
ncbi:MAG: CPBP family intramembrane glutamic endopeptidase [Candidatus Bilamarchaeaceae archaeon]